MTKAKKKVFTLDDFFTKNLNEKATNMALMYDDEDTGCYLTILGIEAKSVQRARIIAQVDYADMAEAEEKITDSVDKAEFKRDTKENIEIDLAMKLVTGWSFGEFSKGKLLELFEQNQGLAIGVIAHATTPENYLAKK